MDDRTKKAIAAMKRGADPLCALAREIKETNDPNEAWALCATGKWIVLLSASIGSTVRYSLGRVRD